MTTAIVVTHAALLKNIPHQHTSRWLFFVYPRIMADLRE